MPTYRAGWCGGLTSPNIMFAESHGVASKDRCGASLRDVRALPATTRPQRLRQLDALHGQHRFVARLHLLVVL